MTLATLDSKTALIVVDLQKGLMAHTTVPPLAEVVGRAADLARAFRSYGLTVVLVNVAGSAPGRTETARSLRDLPPDFLDFAPELTRAPADLVVTKHTWGAFTGTWLEARLREAGVTQVVVCGVSTSVGVESTARQAHELGLNVVLAVDAMTDTSAEARANSLERIFPRLGERATSEEIVARVGQAMA